MNRSLRIATGIVVLLALVFASGMFSGERAFADGLMDKPPQPQKITLPEKTRLPSKQADGDQRISNVSVKDDVDIEVNTTVGTKTYEANVWVWPDATLTVGTNANVIINGDLYIFGSVVISSGTLTVNGDIEIYGSLTVKGTAKLIVNKAPVVNFGYYGGHIIIADDGAIMTVSGSATATINYVTKGGLYIFEGGKLKMDSATAKLTVNNDCYFGGASTSGLLTAGTLEIVNGGFYQAADSSNSSFSPGPSFNVSLKGTNSTQRQIAFETPAASYFDKLTISGVTFTTDSTISLKKSLTADYSINANNARVYLQGALNGKNLTVTAGSVCPGYQSSLTIGTGKLTVNGALVFGTNCALTMNDPAGKIAVNGSFRAFRSDSIVLTEGSLDINGDFIQTGTPLGYPANSFVPGPNFNMKISGANRSVKFDNPEASYFTKFSLGAGASISSDSIISIKTDLQSNQNLSYPNLNYRGNLNGYNLTATNLTVPAGNTLTVGAGTLTVNGNLTVAGDLVMTEAADKVIVTGNYTASSASASTDLSDGKLYIAGNFDQSGNAASFLATGSHTTILNGSGAQTVTFGSASSRFATLVILNDAIDPASIPAQYDSIAVSGTTMKGIAPSAGALSPAFGADVHEYVVLLPTGTDSVTITPEFLDRYAGSAWMTEGDGTDPITAVTVDAIPYDGSKTVTVKAHAYNDLAAATYTFKVMTLNPDLSGLGTLPTGAVIEPAFDPSEHNYTVQLPESVTSFTFAPQADHPESDVHIDTADGPASVTIAPAPGESINKAVRVIAQDGTTEGSYTVTFTRRNPLSGINVSAGTLTPAFSEGTAAYTVNVPTNVPTVTVTALKAETNPDWSKFEITADDSTVEADHVDVALAIGDSKIVSIKAYDKDGKTSATYTVALTRVSMLSNIVPSTGTLTPAFNGNIDSYTVYVPSTTASVKLTPVKTQYCTSMKINQVVVNDVTISVGLGAKNRATIECTNGTGDEAFTSTYTVDVYRVAPITGITITGGTLSPAFAVTTKSYTISVPATTTSVTVKPTVSAYCTDMKMDGLAVESVTLTPPIGGSAFTQITSTGLDSIHYDYKITVVRAPLITGITPSPGALDKAFKATTLEYTVNVPYTTTQVKITPAKAATGVKSLTINGAAVTYAYIKPPLGGSAKAVIKAVGTDGKATVTYTVTVIRTGLISGITLSDGYTLTPAFVGSTSAYTVNLPVTAASVTITPAKTPSCKSFTIDGKAVASKVIAPPAGGSTTCTIVATALNGITKATYTVKVVRNRPITAIGLSTGKMSPAFNAATLNYDVTIPADKPSVTITPTRTTGFNYTINGGAMNTPATIAVALHKTETATIVATYPGGSITYTLTIRRAEAPDNIQLISGDLTPAFDKEVFDYEIHLNHASGPDTVTLGVTVTGDCTVVTSGLKATKPASPGYQVVTITVTPAGDFTVTYTIKIYWD